MTRGSTSPAHRLQNHSGEPAQGEEGKSALHVSSTQAVAFRLARHHLSERAPATALARVAADMAGAQAQVLSAAQISMWARTGVTDVEDVDDAIWRERTLVRAWAMRGTMFLFPSDELAFYSRGVHRRSAYNLRWAQEQVASEDALDGLLDDVAEALNEPRTRSDLARILESRGYRLKSKPGGGWGDSRAVPWIEVGEASLSVGFLLHLVGARDVICSGPSEGNESTYVRAARWVPGWKDVRIEEAEGWLVARYLRSFGPATLEDFALWAGMYIRDAKEIWALQSGNMVQVEVDGQKGYVLRSDVFELDDAKTDGQTVRLLPFFDSFLLGHRSHLNIVDEVNHKKVYRGQGWVSPVLLVDGQARGVWSQVRGKNRLEVRVSAFTRLPASVRERVSEEAAELGRFLGCPDVKTTI